jgi:hypothetical protein
MLGVNDCKNFLLMTDMLNSADCPVLLENETKRTFVQRRPTFAFQASAKFLALNATG